MKRIYLIAIVAALICGGLMYMYLGNVEKRVTAAEKRQTGAAEEMTDVVVAVTDIGPRTRITEAMVVVESIPAKYVEEGTATSLDQVVGLMSDGTIVTGQTIMRAGVGQLEELYTDLSAEISEGLRAMTLSVSVSSGVGGYVIEGDHVDVLGYIQADPDNEIEEKLGIVLEHVLVLRAGDIAFDQEEDELYSSLTLAVTQAQSLELLQLIEKGDIYFTLYPMEAAKGGEQ